MSTPTAAVADTSFLQSIGVNVHMGYSSTPYANVALVESDLSYLGVNSVRDSFFNWSNSQTNFQQLAAAGIKFDFLLPEYSDHTVNIPEFISMINAFVEAHPGSVAAIEGINEANDNPAIYNGGTTLADQAALQQALYSAVRADPNLNGVPIYNLTLANTNSTQYAALGNLSSAANYANEHDYVPTDQAPQQGLAYLLPYAQLNAPGLPTVITETGYNTDPNDAWSGTDQTVQAKYTLDTLMDAFKDGVAQTYLYELLDEASDPTNSNPQDHYGLFNSDGTPKLAATAIHNLTTILSDPSASSSFTPGSLSYTVTHLTAPFAKQLLLEKCNGTFDLVLWAEPQIYTTTEIAAPVDKATVTFAQAEGAVSVFDPLSGTTPIATYTNVQQIQVNITDHPLIIEITNGSIPSVTTVLASPVIASCSPDSGIVGDGITNATTLTLTGTAAANSTVAVFDGTTHLGMATASASGAWTFVTGTLGNGAHSFTATDTDAIGDTSAASAPLAVTVDTVAPAVSSVVASGSGITNGNGDLNAGHVVTLTVTLSEAVTVTGGTPTLKLNDGGTATYTGGSGSNALTFSYTVAAGDNTADLAVTAVNLNAASVTDAAGNAAVLTAAVTTLAGALQIDTTAPAAPVISSDSPASGNAVTLIGTAEANSTVTVYEGTLVLGTVAANSAGAWSYTTGQLAVGSYIFTATATDAAGNVSTMSQPIDPTISTNAYSANNTSLSVTDTNDTVILSGSNDIVNVTGGGNAIQLSGSNDSLTIMGSGNSVNVTGSNDSVSATGVDTVTFSGSGTVVATIGASSTLNLADNLTGSGSDMLALVGSNGTANLNQLAHFSGFSGISLSGSNDTLTLTNANLTVTRLSGSGDTIRLGTGIDTIAYTNVNQSTHSSPDTINGFNTHQDKIDFSAISGLNSNVHHVTMNFLTSTPTNIAGHTIDVVTSRGTTVVYADATGSSESISANHEDMQINLIWVAGVNSSDFILHH